MVLQEEVVIMMKMEEVWKRCGGDDENGRGVVMMMIVPNSRARKRRKERVEVKGEYGRICGEEDVNGGTQYQHVTPCKKGVEWELDTGGLRMVATFALASRYRLHRGPV